MITTVLLMSLFCIGIHYAVKEDNVLNFVPRRIPNWLAKMLFACAPCMATIYGTLVFLLLQPFNWKVWFISLVACSGLNYVIIAICNSLFYIAKAFEDEIENGIEIEDDGNL